MALPADKTVAQAPSSACAPRHVGDRLFIRLLALVRVRLFSLIRSEKDVFVLDSVLSSFFAHHGDEIIDLEDEETFWPVLSRIALRHCNKHNKRAQRDPQPLSMSMGAMESSAMGFEPAADDPSPEAQVEFLEFLSRFQNKLTDRERKVLELALEKEPQKAIAVNLNVSRTTICNDLKHIRTILEAELLQ
jgi:hypothetical protein